VDLHAASLAVEHPGSELSLQVGLHLEEFEPDLYRGDGGPAAITRKAVGREGFKNYSRGHAAHRYS